MTLSCGGDAASRRDYARRRARQIAYGEWQPWAPASPVRAHVRRLRRHGVSFRAIGHAAGVSPMTVHRLMHGDTARNRPAPRQVHASSAQRLLAVTPQAACRAAARRDAAGTRNRLRALTALGYPTASLAARTGATPRAIRDLLNGRTATVSPALHAAVETLYDQLWDIPPDTRTGAQRRAAAAACARAAASGWPAPMGLDDDQINDPAYRPRAHWRPAAASCPRSASQDGAAGRARRPGTHARPGGRQARRR